MRVERSTKDQVASRLALLAQEKEKQKKIMDDTEESFHDIVRAKDKEAQLRKEERARQRKERKKTKKAIVEQPDDEHEYENRPQNSPRHNGLEVNQGEPQEEDVAEETIDPDFATLMGFSGFGGGKKNR